MRRRRFWLVFAAAALLPGFVLAPAWRLAGLGAFEDDILYYYPARAFFHDCLARGEWPTINPWTGLGRPVAADPQAALWYPFTWLFASLPTPVAYPASLWLHYSLALVGMYRLLRSLGGGAPIGGAARARDAQAAEETPHMHAAARASDARCGLHPLAALFGAVAFAFCGFLLAHRAHFALQHAAAWTPWVFWRLRRYTRAGGAGRLAAAAIVAALQALAGHAQIAALTALGTLVYLVAERHGERRLAGAAAGEAQRRTKVAPGATGTAHRGARALGALIVGLAARRGGYTWLGVVAQRWGLAWLCAGGLFAVQLVPTVLFLRECTRSQRGFADLVENSWRPVSIVNWLTPMLFGQRTPNVFEVPYWGPSHQCEQFAYAGILPLLLAGAVVATGWRVCAARRPWAIVLGFSILLALGEFGPVCYALYFVPGGSLFRVPARGLLLFNLSLAVLAALALHALLVPPTPRAARMRALLLGWTARPWVLALVLVVVPALLVFVTTPLMSAPWRGLARASLPPWRPAIALPLVVAFVSALALRISAREWRRAAVGAGLLGVLIADLAIVGWTLDVPAGWPRLDELLNPPARAEWRSAIPQDDAARLWVVTARRGDSPGEYVDPIAKAAANANYLARVPALTDYGPLQPRALVRRLGFAPWGESDRAVELLMDTAWMRAFNVGWVLLCDERWPAPADCELVRTTSRGWRLYRARHPAGEAFALDTAGGAVPQRVVWTHAGRARVPVPDDLPTGARVVLSRVALPGWQAALVDGNGEPGWPRVSSAEEGTLLAVELPPSAGREGHIEWRYETPGLRLGAAVSLATIVLLLCVALTGARSVVKVH